MAKINLDYINQFDNLNYAKFKQMAVDPNLRAYEKVGFPDIYRKDKEIFIWRDIKSKLTNISMPDKKIVDIGPGCSELPMFLLAEAKKNNSQIVLCDCREMLDQLPDGRHIEKVEGPFPECWPKISHHTASVNALLVYSLLHYIYREGNMWLFLDRCFDLLANGGQLLLGDLPNHSKRARFFQSPAGIKFHQQYTGTNELPSVDNNKAGEKLDDSVLMSIIVYAHNRGFDAYILPQANDLPMCNRREDILIVRP